MNINTNRRQNKILEIIYLLNRGKILSDLKWLLNVLKILC